MQIVCSHVSTRYHKPDVDFIIAEYQPEIGQELNHIFVAKGNGLPLDPFLVITFEGTYVEDDKGRGPALIVKSYSTRVRKTRANVLGYLASGAIKGVGTAVAKNIVDVFGLETVEILQRNPERLREVKGIGEQKLQMIVESFSENREIHDLMEYLGQFDISVNKVRRIVKKFGARSLEIVRGDIYHLCEVDGFGFATVDDIARKMGHPMDTLPRVKAAAIYALQENRNGGHLYMEPDDFLKAIKFHLNHESKKVKKEDKPTYLFNEDDLRPLANQAIQNDKIVYVSKCIYLKQDYRNENGFAILMARRLYHDRQAQAVDYPQLVTEDGVHLAPGQEKAVVMALTHNTCIITGSPGTGKTTVLKVFLDSFSKQYKRKINVLLCAPTGRAARRMAEATGYTACTAHKAFMLGSEDEESSSKGPEKWDAVIMDEFSMADQWLAFQVVCNITEDTKLVIVGDHNQLASVGPGNVLRELLRSKQIPTAQLTQIFRQADGSAIAENARRIAQRNTNLIYDDSSFMFVPAENQIKTMQYVCSLYKRAVDLLGMDKVQILTPQRKNGECGANYLNARIQKMAQGDPEKGKKHFDRYFCEGDPVLQNKNHKGINNGDVGVISEVHPGSVKVSFPSLDMDRNYDDDDLRLLELSYAQTVHKAQGTEIPVVIIPVLWEHRFMLTRNLFYTAITRGKVRVVLVGSERAIKKAIMTEDTSKRRTLLADRIVSALKKLEGANVCNTENALKKSA